MKPFFLLVLLPLIGLGAFAQWAHVQTNLALSKIAIVNSDGNGIPDASTLKLFSFGYDQVLCDVYWLAFIQYIGDGAACQKDNGALAYPYLRLITSLDPRFVLPYWFAAFTLGGEQGKSDLAQTIIDGGLQYNQNNWTLPFIAGINQYLYAHNDVAATKFYREAAKYPGAPGWLTRQANILQAKIPSIIKDINVYNNVYATSNNALVKAKAREKLISMWNEVYSRAPNQKIKERASTALRQLESDESTD